MKVGILSMQRIYNYGSFLQAYGLKSILEELGCRVEFVDYHSGECLSNNKKQKKGIRRKLSKAIEVLKSGATLKQSLAFIKFKRNYEKNYFHYLNITSVMNYNPELDLLIIGSDEVFNCIQSNEKVGFAPELFGENHRAKRLISYAASFGNTTLEKLYKYNKTDQVAKLLCNFDNISIRDNNSYKIVSTLTQKAIYRHLDPVLIYDYLNKCDKISNIKDSKYIILYGYSGRFTKEECIAIKKYAKSKELKIYCIGGIQRCGDKFINCSPFEVISYFKSAELIITDTFHGTIFSIITHKPFAVFIRSEGYGNSEKLRDLLDTFSLNNQVVNDISLMPVCLGNKIDYNNIQDILETERNKSYMYLKSNIDALVN